MALKWGYVDNCGTGIGGRTTLVRTAILKMIGLNASSHEFAIDGKPKQVLAWLAGHRELEVWGPEEEPDVKMIVHVYEPRSAGGGDYFLEAFAGGFVKGGGLMARIVKRKIRRLKVTFIYGGGVHRSGEMIDLPGGTSLGEIHTFISTGRIPWDDDYSDSGGSSYASTSYAGSSSSSG